jgi:hypothetical protein
MDAMLLVLSAVVILGVFLRLINAQAYWVGWSGVEWSGVEWSGVEWTGVGLGWVRLG